MLGEIADDRKAEFEDYVEAFESACADDPSAALADFLPERDDPLYLSVLSELIRVDLELSWSRGERRRVEQYRERFPEIFEEPEALWGIGIEEYRLRLQAGEQPSPEEYRKRWGIPLRVTRGPGRQAGAPEVRAEASPAPAAAAPARQDPLQRVAFAYRAFHEQSSAAEAPSLDSWCESLTSNAEQAGIFRDLHLSSPAAADRFARALTSMPEPGSDFLGFHLVQELGRGAFGRVFLARQGELADRYVALKISSDTTGESRTLAQLQHTNIVPIYSKHRCDPFHAVCMPYFGATTLAHVLKTFEDRHSLPVSGKELVSTLHNRRNSTVRGDDPSLLQSEIEPATNAAPAAAAGDHASQPTLKTLEGLTYVQAVLWMGARLADGLAHAHDRGSLHRDLQPANVLLTDDGQPMLLDFNLSEDSKLRAGAQAASVGGTLPYMAPEHLEAFRDGKRPVDARSDLYSLGILLYELLTGRPAFPVHQGPTSEILPRMIADRNGPVPEIRRWNKAVSRASEAIVRRCLHPEPARRYQTAHELCEDLERHLQNLPLRHTREPSLRERLRKWIRRHPRLTSSGAVATAALVLVAGLIASLLAVKGHLARAQARESFAGFQDDLRNAQFLLYARTADRKQLDQGVSQCRRALDRYQVLDQQDWQHSAALSLLPPADREKLKTDVGELLFLSSRATAMLASYESDRQRGRARIDQALEFNDAALNCFESGAVPRAVWQERHELLQELGKKGDALSLVKKLQGTSYRNARDYFLAAQLKAVNGNFRDALPLLERSLQLEPQSFAAWFVKGNCHDGLMQFPEAAACYSTCVALRPDFHWGWFNRGLVRLRLDQAQDACADFTRVLETEPDLAEAYLNRGLAQEALRRYDEAIADLNSAMGRGAPRSEIYLRLARVRNRAGDAPGARRDYEQGMRLPPIDESGWVARGLARMDREPRAALADFDEALKLNPRSFVALQNKSHIFADDLGDDEQAVATLNRAVSLYPDNYLCRAGRGVSLARLGRRQPAVDDAQASLLLDSHPPTLYQVGCIYALTSRQHPDDRLQALPLLSAALKGGFGLDLVDKDRDLDPMRTCAEFQRLVTAAKALHAAP